MSTLLNPETAQFYEFRLVTDRDFERSVANAFGAQIAAAGADTEGQVQETLNTGTSRHRRSGPMYTSSAQELKVGWETASRTNASAWLPRKAPTTATASPSVAGRSI